MIRPPTVAFDARRGIAIGVALTGAGIAGLWVPQVVGTLVEAQGWRTAMMALGALPCIAALFVWVGFCNARKAAALQHAVEERASPRRHSGRARFGSCRL